MKWVAGKPASDGITYYQVSECGLGMVSRARVDERDENDDLIEVWRYTAWGPKGSQDISWIDAATTRALQEAGRTAVLKQRALHVGRHRIGDYRDVASARRAAEQYAEEWAAQGAKPDGLF